MILMSGNFVYFEKNRRRFAQKVLSMSLKSGHHECWLRCDQSGNGFIKTPI